MSRNEPPVKIINGIFCLVGLLFVGLGIPLILEKVGINDWYGVRTEKTMGDESIWYAANKVAGWDMLMAGCVTLVAALILIFLKDRFAKPATPILITLGVFVLALAAAVTHSLVVVSQL